MENQSTADHPGASWALVSSGGKTYIGKVDINDYLQWLRTPNLLLQVREALELHCDIVTIPTPHGPAMAQRIMATTVDAEEGPIDLTLWCVNSLRPFSEMSDKGAKYRKVYEQHMEMTRQALAASSGITLASHLPDSLSGGPFRGSGR